MIRLRSRHIIVIFLAFIVISLLWFRRISSRKTLDPETFRLCPVGTVDESKRSRNVALEVISCTVDNEKTYQCYQDELNNEVYFPFNAFIKKHFDVSGKIIKASNFVKEHFEWSTSHARVRFPNFTHYDYRGAFGHFASYSVETRDRVRCISAQYGVPLSTQWSQIPYFYPIQIAQYALQHYSRFKTVSSSIAFVKGTTSEEWNDSTIGRDGLKIDFDETANVTRVEISAADYGISLALSENPTFVVLSFFWMADVDGSFTISVKLVHTGKALILHYIHSDDERCVWHDNEANEFEYYYSLGAKPNASEWRWICRDLLVDTGRALASTASKKETILLHPGDVLVNSITFRGHSIIRDFRQRSSAHLEHFLVAADWLTTNQDEEGGWPVPVERWLA